MSFSVSLSLIILALYCSTIGGLATRKHGRQRSSSYRTNLQDARTVGEVAKIGAMLPVSTASLYVARDILRRLSKTLTVREHLDNPTLARHSVLFQYCRTKDQGSEYDFSKSSVLLNRILNILEASVAPSPASPLLLQKTIRDVKSDCELFHSDDHPHRVAADAVRLLGSLAPLPFDAVRRLDPIIHHLCNQLPPSSKEGQGRGRSGSVGGQSIRRLNAVSVSGLRWASARIGLPSTLFECTYEGTALREATAALPFTVIPASALRKVQQCQRMATDENLIDLSSVAVSDLLAEVPFKSDDIVTASGRTVAERRETAWQTAVRSIGGFHYSGKTMLPQSYKHSGSSSSSSSSSNNNENDDDDDACARDNNGFSPIVQQIARAVEVATGATYDCVLLNYYPDGDSAMRYHIDPDQGIQWGNDTAVVSVGETRRFCFRAIPSSNHGDTTQRCVGFPGSKSSRRGGEVESDASGRVHSFHVFSGDVVHMFGHCQYLYQHCVMKAENGPTVMDTTDAARRSSSTQRRTSEEQKPEYPTPGNGPRISLVFKQSAAYL